MILNKLLIIELLLLMMHLLMNFGIDSHILDGCFIICKKLINTCITFYFRFIFLKINMNVAHAFVII